MQPDGANDPLLEEMTKETEKRKRALVDHLGRLVNDPAWVYIRRVLKHQAELLYNSVGRSIPDSVGAVLLQQKERGLAEAYEILASMPDFLREGLMNDLDLTEEDLQDDATD